MWDSQVSFKKINFFFFELNSKVWNVTQVHAKSLKAKGKWKEFKVYYLKPKFFKCDIHDFLEGQDYLFLNTWDNQFSIAMTRVLELHILHTFIISYVLYILMSYIS